MIDDLLRIGDQVTITIEQENRSWGYNPCPDGTKATVVGFSEIHYGRLQNFGYEPGVYTNKAWVKLVLEDGREHTEWSGRLQLSDQNEYDRRVQHWQQDTVSQRKKEYLRALPDTPFWEGDQVRAHARLAMAVMSHELSRHDHDVFVVTNIDYARLKERTNADTKWPVYDISVELGASWHTSASEDDLQLLARGNVWKYYHDEPLVFANLKEEAGFFSLLGQIDEIPNPASNLYSWNKAEVLEAISQATVHGFSIRSGFFNTTHSCQAIRFRNEELGRRVAQATLHDFGLAT